jgi:hypothetical protein
MSIIETPSAAMSRARVLPIEGEIMRYVDITREGSFFGDTLAVRVCVTYTDSMGRTLSYATTIQPTMAHALAWAYEH